MSAQCQHKPQAPSQLLDLPRYRRILWIALIVNAAMFFVELGAGYRSGSVSLLADAIDFAGDAANYAVSLAVLAAALSWRARAAQLKAVCMIGFGLFVLGRAAWGAWMGAIAPDAGTMGVISILALVANIAVAWMLYAFREGNANMRTVWLCSRNDAISGQVTRPRVAVHRFTSSANAASMLCRSARRCLIISSLCMAISRASPHCAPSSSFKSCAISPRVNPNRWAALMKRTRATSSSP